MIYSLITPTGHEFEFYILSCAELYQDMYGGTLCALDQEHMQDTITLCDQLSLL